MYAYNEAIMAALFLLFALVIGLGYVKCLRVALWGLALAWILCAFVLWYHATSALNVRW